MLSREEALVLIRKYNKDQNLLKNSISVEAILREIARRIGKNEELWGLTGLLHNLDYDYTKENPEKRGMLSAQILEDLIPEDCINAIKANNYMHTDYLPVTSLDKSLISAAAVTYFVNMVVRSIPSKQISEVDLETLLSKFNDSDFSTKDNKNKINLCVDVGFDLEAFFKLTLITLKNIFNE
jgi:predicted hydrolase (HD superfamily)